VNRGNEEKKTGSLEWLGGKVLNKSQIKGLKGGWGGSLSSEEERQGLGLFQGWVNKGGEKYALHFFGGQG